MRYKIPVQIENEDTIVFGLSLRQLIIIAVGGGFGYSLFKTLSNSVDPTMALIFASPIFIITLVVALFRKSEMTFLPFVLNYLRLKLSPVSRMWQSATESFSALEVGYVTSSDIVEKKSENTKGGNSEVFENVEDKLKKL
ncbi:MAG: PrgI family protein [Candidatus Gracilibacteria bacterium]